MLIESRLILQAQLNLINFFKLKLKNKTKSSNQTSQY